MKNKRGWMRIMEATVAIMLVGGVLLMVYSDQTDRRVPPSDYITSLERQILYNIASNSSLRLNVLNLVKEEPGDANFDNLSIFIDNKIPYAFGFSIRVCGVGNTTDFCKMDNNTYIATIGKDIFSEDVIISSDLSGGAIYNPKRLRLFVWEGKREPYSFDPYLIFSGFDSADWDLFGDASISGDILRMTDNGNTNLGTRTGATYKGGDSRFNSDLFFVARFDYKRIDLGVGKGVSFLSYLDKVGNPITIGKPLQLKDGQTDLGVFGFLYTSYQASGVPVGIGSEYGLRLKADTDSSGGDVSLDIDSDNDGIYDEGSVTLPVPPITNQGFTPRFDCFNDGSAIVEISNLRIYGYPDEAVFLSLN